MVDNYIGYQIDHEKADPKYPYVPSQRTREKEIMKFADTLVKFRILRITTDTYVHMIDVTGRPCAISNSTPSNPPSNCFLFAKDCSQNPNGLHVMCIVRSHLAIVDGAVGKPLNVEVGTLSGTGDPSFIHILCRFDSPQTGYFLAGFGGIWLACLLCWVRWAISLCFWFDWLGLWVIVTQQPDRLDPPKNFSKRVEQLQKDPTQDTAY